MRELFSSYVSDVNQSQLVFNSLKASDASLKVICMRRIAHCMPSCLACFVSAHQDLLKEAASRVCSRCFVKQMQRQSAWWCCGIPWQLATRVPLMEECQMCLYVLLFLLLLLFISISIFFRCLTGICFPFARGVLVWFARSMEH